MALPGGSWSQSAQNPRFENGILRANLCNTRGVYLTKAIKEIPGCTFKNLDGDFAIESIDSSVEGAPPGGEWIKTAQSPRLENGILRANLLSKRGNYLTREIKVIPGCTFMNLDGYFAIEHINSSVEGAPPGGEWIKTALSPRLAHGILRADLLSKRGNYLTREIKVIPGCTFMNLDGYFAIESIDSSVPGAPPGGEWIKTALSPRLADGILRADLLSKRGNYLTREIKVSPGCSYTNLEGNFAVEDKLATAMQNMSISKFALGAEVEAYWKDQYHEGWYPAIINSKTESGYTVTFTQYASWGQCSILDSHVRVVKFPVGATVQAYWNDSSFQGWYRAKIDSVLADGYTVTFTDYPQWGSYKISSTSVKP